MTAPRAEPGRLRLAVIVPALDEAEALPELLGSVARGADPERDAVWVVDGGSGDGTPDVARAHGARVLRAPRGRGLQLAAGARAAGPVDVLVFLHADCTLDGGALEHVRKAFQDPSLVAAGMRQRIDAEGWFYRAVERSANTRVRRGWIYGDSGLAVRRAMYERAGGFASIPLFEDLDLSRRLRRLGRTALVEDAVLHVSARRWQEEGRLAVTLRNWALTAAWAAGVAPERLVRHYRPHRGQEHREVAA